MQEEQYEAARYYFSLGMFSPVTWGVQPDMQIDMPGGLRDIVHYRTTLGHKGDIYFSVTLNTTNSHTFDTEAPIAPCTLV